MAEFREKGKLEIFERLGKLGIFGIPRIPNRFQIDLKEFRSIPEDSEGLERIPSDFQ
jgi:hypothetical protein